MKKELLFKIVCTYREFSVRRAQKWGCNIAYVRNETVNWALNVVVCETATQEQIGEMLCHADIQLWILLECALVDLSVPRARSHSITGSAVPGGVCVYI